MPIAHLSSVDLYYELHGPADAPLLVLLHGATETFRSGWRRQIEPFSQRFRILGVDLRGHGRSNNPADELDLRQMADDIRELLQALGQDRAHVCGHSGGASTALFFALRHPEALDRLVLVSNNFELDRVRTGPSHFWDPARIQREQPGWWAEMVRLHPDPVRLLAWWDQEDRRRPNFQPQDLAHVQAPTLLVNGDRDEIIPLEQTLGMYRALPNAQLAILPGVGHGVPSRRPAWFNLLALDFLTGGRRGPRRSGVERPRDGRGVTSKE